MLTWQNNTRFVVIIFISLVKGFFYCKERKEVEKSSEQLMKNFLLYYQNLYNQGRFKHIDQALNMEIAQMKHRKQSISFYEDLPNSGVKEKSLRALACREHLVWNSSFFVCTSIIFQCHLCNSVFILSQDHLHRTLGFVLWVKHWCLIQLETRRLQCAISRKVLYCIILNQCHYLWQQLCSWHCLVNEMSQWRPMRSNGSGLFPF